MRLAIVPVVLLAAVLAMSAVGAAELPFTPAGLAHLEGTLDACARAIPDSAADYRKQKERLVQGVSEEELAKVRAGDEYQAAYKAIGEQLEQLPKDQATEACHAFLGTAASPARDTHN